MGDNIVSLRDVRARREAEEHARALVIFECAAALARQNDAGLLRLIETTFGPEFIANRVRETLTPVAQTEAPKHAKSKRPLSPA